MRGVFRNFFLGQVVRAFSEIGVYLSQHIDLDLALLWLKITIYNRVLFKKSEESVGV